MRWGFFLPILLAILTGYASLMAINGVEMARDLVHVLNALFIVVLLVVIRYETNKREKILDDLRTQNNRLLMMFDQLPFGVYTVDGAGLGIAYWNQWLVENTGISKEEARGKTAGTVFLIESLDRLKTVSSEGLHPIYEGVYKDEQGAEHIYQITKVMVQGFGNEEMDVTVVNDVTEYKHLERKLMQSDKMNAIGQLAGGIAHDFNNQLMGVAGHASLLLDGCELGQRMHLQKILHQTQVASDLVHKLLTFSNQNIHFERYINIPKIVEHILESYRMGNEKNVKIETQFCGGGCFVLGDEAFIESALLNIIKNAYEAVDDNGIITIATAERHLTQEEIVAYYQELQEGDYCIVEIKNTGSRVKDSEIEKWFEPFYTTKPFGEGHGMGLSAVYGTISKHNGGIKVVSREGEGTTFTVALPVDKRALVEKGFDIVILDDDEIVRELIEAILVSNGFGNVKLIASAEGFNPNETSLLITDKNVHKDFVQFIKKCTRDHKLLKIIGISGYFTEEDCEIALGFENLKLLEKPIETKVMIKTIELLMQINK